VFQESRLFPHLNVRGNLEYGMKLVPRRERRITFDEVVQVLGIGALLTRRAHRLSGGEKQRVAIGRALLTSPRLLLMDEPLASLDGPRKNEILPFIEGLSERFAVPIVYVTHAMDEIIRLADTLVLISDGTVAATGAVEDLTSRLDLRPLTGRYEAGSVIATRVGAHDERYGLTRLEFAGGGFSVPRVALPEGTPMRVRVRARDVALALTRPEETSFANVFEGTVTEIGDQVEGQSGAQVDIRLDIGVPLWSRITRRSMDDLGIVLGLRVFALVKGTSIDRYSQARLKAGAVEGDEDGG
jgi:molybdate transport system ATP-binding protein